MWRLPTIFLAPSSRKDKSLHLYTHARICYLKPVYDDGFICRSLVCKWKKKAHYTIFAWSWSGLGWKQISVIPISSIPSIPSLQELARQASTPVPCVHNPWCWKKASDATTDHLLEGVQGKLHWDAFQSILFPTALGGQNKCLGVEGVRRGEHSDSPSVPRDPCVWERESMSLRAWGISLPLTSLQSYGMSQAEHVFSEEILLVLAWSGVGLVLNLLPVAFMCVTDNVGLVVFRDSRVCVYLSILPILNCPSVFFFPDCKQIFLFTHFWWKLLHSFLYYMIFILEDWRDAQSVGTSGTSALINFRMNIC